MASWIKLYLNVDKNAEFREFEEAMREGRKGQRQKRIAEDIAFAQVIRLYILLGQTSDGRLEFRKTGDRLLAEDVMRESGDELILIFDRMAAHGVIDRDLWATRNVVTTSNAIEQAERRRFYKDRSKAANKAKREKATKDQESEP